MDEMRTSFKRQNLRKKNGSAKIWWMVDVHMIITE
jgi:hypothetical protein